MWNREYLFICVNVYFHICKNSYLYFYAVEYLHLHLHLCKQSANGSLLRSEGGECGTVSTKTFPTPVIKAEKHTTRGDDDDDNFDDDNNFLL